MHIQLGSFKLWHVPVRAATGGFILQSGIDKRSADEETAAGMHDLATITFPFFKRVTSNQFQKGLYRGEIALGTALLIPVVPPLLAGSALTAFSSALLCMYWKTPGTHEKGILWPTMQGMPLAENVWMLGIGISLVLDALATKQRPL